MEIGFAAALLVVGGLLWLVAALTGVIRGTVLSTSVLSVGCGVGLAELGVVSVDPASEDLRHLVEVALIVTLFSDGLVVERELLRRHWSSPARSLVVALPITLVLIAVGAKVLFAELTWAEAFLLGAVLAPTDPVVSSVVVTAQRVPARVRHALNLESGLNDGLAVPLVLFFLILAVPEGGAGTEGLQLAGEAVAGAAIGAGLGYLGGRAHPRLPGKDLTAQFTGIFALGLCLLAFGTAELTIGNGLVAAFMCGVALALREEGTPEPFTAYTEYASAIVQVIVFFAFGALIVATGFDQSLLALAAMIVFAFTVARPAAVWIASLGSGLSASQRAFIAWFGPKGVASMLFALVVLNSQAPDRSVVFDIAAFVILASIFTHGLTDTVAARWIAGQASEEEIADEEEPGGSESEASGNREGNDESGSQRLSPQEDGSRSGEKTNPRPAEGEGEAPGASDSEGGRIPMAEQLNGKKIAFLTANEGVEQVELTEPLQAVREAGAEAALLAPEAGDVQAFNHLDKGDVFDAAAVADADAADFDGLVLPGGVANPDQLRTKAEALDFIRAFFEAGKPVGVICHGPWSLIDADVVRGRTLTSWPSLQTDLRNAGAEWVDEEVHVDQGLVSSRKPDDLEAFNAKIVEEFAEGVHEAQREQTVGAE